MNFYAIGGTHGQPTLFALNLDKSAQGELTAMFAPLVKAAKTADTVPFDPSYRADEGEILTVTPYSLPSGLAPLIDAANVAALPALKANDVEQAGIRAIAAIEWKGNQPRHVAFQRLEKRYILTKERHRFMLAHGRLVRDDRPGLEIAERLDAVLDGDTLYVAAWAKAHAVLDLSMWIREATLAETETFLKHKRFAFADGFETAIVTDSLVRRKITSITASNVLDACTPQALRAYAKKFNVVVEVAKGRIVLPADKKLFKAVLGLLDQDFLSFEPTDEHWVVNSKRRVVT